MINGSYNLTYINKIFNSPLTYADFSPLTYPDFSKWILLSLYRYGMKGHLVANTLRYVFFSYFCEVPVILTHSYN